MFTTNQHQSTQDDDLLDAAQVAAQEFGGRVTARTVESWRSTARALPLPFIRVGGKCLYRRGDVRAFKADQRAVPSKGKA